MRVVEAGDNRTAAKVDHLRRRPRQRQDITVAANGEKATVANSHGLGEGAPLVLGGDAAAMENKFGGKCGVFMVLR